MAQAKAIEDDMFPAQKEGHKTGMMHRNPWPEGMETDYVRLIQDLFKQHDVARQSSAADLVAQARPRQLLLYRRLLANYTTKCRWRENTDLPLGKGGADAANSNNLILQ